MSDENRNWQEQVKEMAIDVRNEAIMQGASLYMMARRVLLAGMGAVALTRDEAEVFVDKLVERGELAEADAQKLLQEFQAKAKERTEKLQSVAGRVQSSAEKGSEPVESAFEERIAAVLHRMNVPSKKDIDALSQQLEALSAKIDALQTEE